MKITKGQLKRIIAEEHAVVYGTKRRTRRPVGTRRVAKKRYLSEAKREMINEIQARAISNQLMEAGFFSALKAGFKTAMGLGGEAAGAALKKGAEAANAVKGKVGSLATAAGEQIEAMKKAGEDALAAVQEKYLDQLKKDIMAKIEAATKELAQAMKSESDDIDDEAVKAQVSSIVLGALGGATEAVVEGAQKHKLLESKRKQRIIKNRRRRTLR